MSTCLDDNGLADLFGEAADDARTTAMDVHVAGCESCRRLVGTYARLFGECIPGDDGDAPQGAGAASLGLPLPGPTVLARAWAEAQLGRTIGGRWRLERVLGIGGSAVVFEAVHRNGSKVAIKILRPEHRAIASLMGRFMREAYVANQIDHPGVVRVIDDGSTDEGAPFLVMDLLEGHTLRERVERDGTLGHDAAIALCTAVLDVLAKAHERGVIHRDLKPDNLFFDASGAVRVLDFGIARLTTTEGAELTQTGLGMGTSAYMPPEQARGEWEAVGARSDLWALAATTVFAMGRRPPHVAANAQKTLVLAATTSAPGVASIVPDIRAGLARALDHALAFDPDDRPRDARAMAEEIAAAHADTTPALLASGPRRTRTRWFLLTSVIVLGGGATVALVERPWRGPTAASPEVVTITPEAVPSAAIEPPSTSASLTQTAEAPPALPADRTGRVSPRPAAHGVRPPASAAAAASAIAVIPAPAATSAPPPEGAPPPESTPASIGSALRHRH